MYQLVKECEVMLDQLLSWNKPSVSYEDQMKMEKKISTLRQASEP
jgi:hypothetical protein